jgi:predicted nuclease with RNAse H fold
MPIAKRLGSIVLGVDLAGAVSRPTGLCVLKEDERCTTQIVHRDDEIVESAMMHRPCVVAVDAPLSLPKGRQSLDRREPIHFRQCDLELRRRRIKFFPITIGPMRVLTKRGIALKQSLEARGFRVIEVFPGGAQDVLGLPRKQNDLPKLIRGLRRLGLTGLMSTATGDEVDAATCALTGLLYLRANCEALGDVNEGQIIMPRTRQTE